MSKYLILILVTFALIASSLCSAQGNADERVRRAAAKLLKDLGKSLEVSQVSVSWSNLGSISVSGVGWIMVINRDLSLKVFEDREFFSGRKKASGTSRLSDQALLSRAVLIASKVADISDLQDRWVQESGTSTVRIGFSPKRSIPARNGGNGGSIVLSRSGGEIITFDLASGYSYEPAENLISRAVALKAAQTHLGTSQGSGGLLRYSNALPSEKSESGMPKMVPVWWFAIGQSRVDIDARNGQVLRVLKRARSSRPTNSDPSKDFAKEEKATEINPTPQEEGAGGGGYVLGMIPPTSPHPNGMTEQSPA